MSGAAVGVRSGLVYTRRGRDVVARRVADGAEEWRYEVPEPGDDGVAVSLPGKTAAVVAGDRVVGLDAVTGEERWRFVADAPVEDAALGGSEVYLATERRLYALGVGRDV